MDKINFAVIEDDNSMVKLITERIKATDGLTLEGTARTIADGTKLLRESKATIDVALIDLVLPDGDGLDLLEALTKEGPRPTVCIVLSGMGSEANIKMAAELGADHFVKKPISDFDALIKRAISIFQSKQHSRKTSDDDAKSENESLIKSSPPNPKRNIDEMDRMIHALMEGLPVNQSLTGYRYIKTAVRMSVEDRSLLENISKGLYPALAKLNNSTDSRVERNIRHTILKIWEMDGGKRCKELTGIDGKPTNSHFIAALVEKYLHS